MYQFECTICQQKHKYITLIECPDPDIIYQIRREGLDKKIVEPLKGVYLIDNDYVLIRGILRFEIINQLDTLDIQVWVKIVTKEFANKFESIQDKNIKRIKMKGSVDAVIPFYKNAESIEIDILINLEQEEENFTVSNIYGNDILQEDLENGISLEKLNKMMEVIYH